ncbi:aminotransferase class III-fold pyridoxal phosphate-dependent enzyme [Leucobacter allii]|uniref:Aminotransferase class III-fold pyridoxal phosphate-dependent enzyme n=1 Tax=Leucobacter allii TaxID=2932247 RepID=A0ABY4FIF7_9MICO|nr:aminotransferase class III-fold pyridoxal phosphate-dependent enzyme [Leucobacter allii]UOQ56449.1 aminotransferase class III-fold pyridoxal phosphate-dependent enzyme [Leucobacter allii]
MNGADASPVDRADRVIPGACFGYTRIPDEDAFVASHGRGSRIFTTAETELVDYTLGSGPLLVGHAHPRVTRAIAEQAAKGTHFYAMNEPAISLAELIVESVPRVEAVKFCADGSQATFFAMRLARAATGRETVMKFAGAYHGHHDYALPSFPGVPEDRGAVGADSLGIPAGATEKIVVAGFNDLVSAQDMARAHRGDLAAIIVEPVQRSLPPAPGFLQGLRELADETGALLIFDEVVTGFRLSRGGAQERYGVHADLVALGKAVGGGTAVGAVAASRELIEYLVPGSPGASQRSFMSGTLNGNPLGAAAGLALLRELDEARGREAIAAHVAEVSAGLRDLAQSKSIALDLVGPDVFFDVVFAPREPVVDLASYLSSDRAASTRFGAEMLHRGIYVVPGAKFYVSSAHTSADAERFLAAADAALDVVASVHDVAQ